MDSDWELELIHTRTGVKHFVAMAPGDMVLYESCSSSFPRKALTQPQINKHRQSRLGGRTHRAQQQQ